MNRTQTVLAAALVVQVLLIIVTRGPFAGSSKALESSTLLPVLESVTPAKLEINGSDDETLTLIRDGSQWAIQEADGYPADDTKVQSLIDKLKDLKVRRPVVTASRYHEALKVTDKDHERRVRVWDDPNGSAKAGLYLGTSPNYRITHVRKEGDDRVYEVSGLGAFDVQQDAKGWIRSKLIDLDPTTITQVKFENASGRFELEKGEDGAWSISSPASAKGSAVDETKLTELLRLATGINVTEPAGGLDRGAQGFERPAVSVTMTPGATASGISAGGSSTEVTLLVGGPVAGEDNKRYITRSGFDHAGIVYESSVKKLLDQKLSDLR